MSVSRKSKEATVMPAMAPEDSPFCVAPAPIPMVGVAVAPKPVMPVAEDPPDPRPPSWLGLDEP